MAGIGAILGVVSSAVGLMGSFAQAKYMKAQARAEQNQLGMMAAEQRAVASRDAMAKAKEGRLLLSRQQAVAAASGGGATDPTVMELAGDISKESSAQTRELMRQGLQKGQDLEYKGKVGTKMADAQAKMTILGGIGNFIGGVGQSLGGLTDAFSKYGQGMPTSASLYNSGSRGNSSGVPAWYYG